MGPSAVAEVRGDQMRMDDDTGAPHWFSRDHIRPGWRRVWTIHCRNSSIRAAGDLHEWMSVRSS